LSGIFADIFKVARTRVAKGALPARKLAELKSVNVICWHGEASGNEERTHRLGDGPAWEKPIMANARSQGRTSVAEAPTSAKPRAGRGRTVEERIRARAYQIFEARITGGAPGDPAADWLQAESELRRPRKTRR